jgi:hypothetical protein
MANVRPPGYYVSWYHFVADLPASTNVNLYDFITQNSRWNSSSKKLNAIITITENTTISARDITRSLINADGKPAVTGPDAAIYVPPTTPFGQGSFRSYDRVTIINKGKIKGAYAYRDYGNWLGNNEGFIPPTAIKHPTNGTGFSSDNLTDEVKTVRLETRSAGGGGGGPSNQNAGAGGGGGGSGGRNINNNATVIPGTVVSATVGSGGAAGGHEAGGGKGGDTDFTQGTSELIKSIGGEGGTGGQDGGQREVCWVWTPFSVFCATVYNTGNGGTGGAGGSAGGARGSDGTDGPEAKERDNVAPRGKGGAGGAKENHSSGGKGGTASRTPDGAGQAAKPGQDGAARYDYTRREIYGPALVVRHVNTFLNNDSGKIIGGYRNYKPEEDRSKWAIYGSGNLKKSEEALNDYMNTNIVGGATTAVI